MEGMGIDVIATLENKGRHGVNLFIKSRYSGLVKISIVKLKWIERFF